MKITGTQSAAYGNASIMEGWNMQHKATGLKFLEGTVLEVTFQDGRVRRYDIAVLFDRYPQLRELEDRELFLSGTLMGDYGIIWNDELDLETEIIYEDGETPHKKKPAARRAAAPAGKGSAPGASVSAESASGAPASAAAAAAVAAARSRSGMSQKQLSAATGIDQADISRIERGLANPAVSTLERIARALGGQLTIGILFPENE
ncbi:MAG: helix-turn-helix domain-containing protein [Clostridiales bacterium]|nr:helix-turn-helix domain-containing protein [Clostridiales bacterium]